ncbi:hypothetical protein [Sphingomonas hengshuiensis]|uniref:hypothetical protein n=1 Tax=Sphingomonas hengshuiensis TaxID=1609977 RepID=UPI00069903B5|nr:hypothetical protein [Sphingomonas hengshuiensis]
MGATVKTVIGGAIIAAGLTFNLLSFDSFLFFGLPMIAGVAAAFWNTRRHPGYSTAEQTADLLRVYMGGHLLWSCLRYWMSDLQPAINHPVGGPFVESLVAMHAFPAIKTIEGFVGVLLLVNRFVPLALVVEIPTAVTIFYLNTFVTARLSGILTGPPELGVNVALMLLYFEHYRPMLAGQARVAPHHLIRLNRRANGISSAPQGPN